MRFFGSIHKRNYTGTECWYFVKALQCDLFLGELTPNDHYIKEEGVLIEDSEVKEWFSDGLVVTGEVEYYYPDENYLRAKKVRYKNITYTEIQLL